MEGLTKLFFSPNGRAGEPELFLMVPEARGRSMCAGARSREPEALFQGPFGQFQEVSGARGGVPDALTRVPGSFEKIMINCG